MLKVKEVGATHQETLELDKDGLTSGPKAQELPPKVIPASQLLSKLDFSPDLNPQQRSALEKVVSQSQNAFGLDGRLCNYNPKVEINLRPKFPYLLIMLLLKTEK